MGTKNNPAPYDCYANAHPDEPMFVLLGRDAWAAELVRLWASSREGLGDDQTKITEARACADAMETWCRSLGKTPRTALYTDLTAKHFIAGHRSALLEHWPLIDKLIEAALDSDAGGVPDAALADLALQLRRALSRFRNAT